MTSRKRKVESLRALCAHLDEDDGIDPRDDKRRYAAPRAGCDRKLEQLCKQVAQTLRLVLAGLPQSEALAGISVQEVAPVSDAGRLRVILAVSEPVRRAAAQVTIERYARYLRMEVAASITRRRAPELAFEVCVLEGGRHG
jgi:ribosome-binding factor A